MYTKTILNLNWVIFIKYFFSFPIKIHIICNKFDWSFTYKIFKNFSIFQYFVQFFAFNSSLNKWTIRSFLDNSDFKFISVWSIGIHWFSKYLASQNKTFPKAAISFIVTYKKDSCVPPASSFTGPSRKLRVCPA